jgi:RND family efflux transporter MFP subunit
MARIEESNARIEIEKNKLARAEEQLTLAERDMERLKALRTSGTATDKALDDRELVLSQRVSAVDQTRINISAEQAKLAQQQAAADRLRWKVEQAARNLANTTLIAPFAGIVRSATVEKGKMLNANDIAVSLYDASDLEVRFTLTDERFARLQSDAAGLIGRKIDVVWSSRNASAALPGRIDRLGSDVAADRGGVQAYATLNTDASEIPIRPGAFVEIRIPDRLFASHYRVPESAIYSGDTVYVVVDGRLQARQVAVSAYDGEFALVTGNIADGDELLTTRITEIGDGLRVVRAGQDAGGPQGKERGQRSEQK